jgi:type I restriction enzyme S subunit
MYKVDSASAQPNLLLSKMRATEIYVPPIALQNQFASFVQKVEAQKTLFQKSLAAMELNYKSLMQKCFRGEIICE